MNHGNYKEIVYNFPVKIGNVGGHTCITEWGNSGKKGFDVGPREILLLVHQ